MVFFTDVEELCETFFEALEFSGIFLVSIFQMFESTGGVYVVTRIDTNFFDGSGSNVGYEGIEVNVSHEGTVITETVELLADVLEVFGFALSQ